MGPTRQPPERERGKKGGSRLGQAQEKEGEAPGGEVSGPKGRKGGKGEGIPFLFFKHIFQMHFFFFKYFLAQDILVFKTIIT